MSFSPLRRDLHCRPFLVSARRGPQKRTSTCSSSPPSSTSQYPPSLPLVAGQVWHVLLLPPCVVVVVIYMSLRANDDAKPSILTHSSTSNESTPHPSCPFPFISMEGPRMAMRCRCRSCHPFRCRRHNCWRHLVISPTMTVLMLIRPTSSYVVTIDADVEVVAVVPVARGGDDRRRKARRGRPNATDSIGRERDASASASYAATAVIIVINRCYRPPPLPLPPSSSTTRCRLSG